MRIFGVALCALLGVSSARADVTIDGGNIPLNAVWTAAQGPYIIRGDITVPMGSSLTIQAGTVVQMQTGDLQVSGVDQARVELVVKGTLIVNGTAAQPVQFTSQGTGAGSWHGIVVDAAASGTALNATYLTIANPVVGIYHRSVGATPTTANIAMTGVSTTGVRVEAGSPTYNGIAVTGGQTGFETTAAGSATFTQCIARNTSSYGVRHGSSSTNKSLTLTNCTLDDNGSFGVYSSASSGGTVVVKNSIVTGSSNGCYRGDGSAWSVTYSNVWGNGSSNNANFIGGSGPGANVISTNPLYVSATNLELTSNSPSRFAGETNVDQGARPYTNVATPGLYGTLWTNTTLTAAASPYTVGGDLSVGPGVTLTLQPGTTLAFAATDIMAAGVDRARGELTARGALVATGSSNLPVTLRGASAAAGSWHGIVVDPAATGTAVTLSNVNVLSPTIGIYHRSSSATAATSAVSMTDVSTTGVRVEAGAPAYDGVATQGGATGFETTAAGTATFTNCIARNTNSYGARHGSSSTNKNLTLINCTLHDNGSFGVYSSASSGGSVIVTNSIVTGSSNGCYRGDGSAWSVTYSNVWGNGSSNNANFIGGAGPGANVISANPQFVSTTNLQLLSTSVAIDAGTANTAPTRDQRGAARPVNGDGINGAEYDMGAYEFAASAICGNGAMEGAEVCDSGAMNGMYGFCNTGCTALGPRCGDAMTNGPETCDDGNGVDTDACRNTCVSAACGDGVIQAGVEQCDDNNVVDTDACTATCQTARCGDGVVREGMEACDDGNTVDTDACHSCVAATCGDGFVRTGVEGCDDGNTIDTDACSNACVSTTCGDVVVQPGVEECDDGNDIDTDECRNACIDPVCGDNIRQPDEQCDDGNMDNGDGCSMACRYEVPNPGSDAGIDPPGGESDGGCCSIGASGGASGTASSLLALFALAFTLRRRRSTRR